MDKVSVSEIRTPGPSGNVRSLVYRPIRNKRTMPVLVYAHGGGWCMGAPEDSDLVCRKLSLCSEVVVVSVDYSLAPEFPYPHGLEDFVSVYGWVRETRPTNSALIHASLQWAVIPPAAIWQPRFPYWCVTKAAPCRMQRSSCVL